MDCFNVKNILDKYIERDLPDKVISEVRKHLSSCDKCSAELKYLQKLRKELKSIDSVKAPPDFLVQLNRRIDSRESGSMFRKIFFPLKIKLPVEAAGVLVTIALIMIFFMPRDEFKESLPLAEKSGYLKEDNEQGLRIAKMEKPGVAAKRSADLATTRERKKSKARTIAGIDDKKLKEVRTYEIAMLLQEPHKILEKSVPGEEAEGDFNTTAGSPAVSEIKSAPDAVNKMSGELAAKKDKREAPAPAEAGADLGSAEIMSDSVRIDEKQTGKFSVEEAIEKIKNTATRMNGRIIRKGISEKDKNIKFVIVEIPAERKAEFLNKISRFGKIKQPGEQPEKNKTGNLRYKINFDIQ